MYVWSGSLSGISLSKVHSIDFVFGQLARIISFPPSSTAGLTADLLNNIETGNYV